MIPHEIKLFCAYSIISASIGWLIKKLMDSLSTEIQRERKRIIKLHVKDSHKTSLKTCTKDECTNLQSPALLEMQVQELSH